MRTTRKIATPRVVAVAIAAVCVAAACDKSAVVVTRTVNAYVPAACGVGADAYALYTATGDFDPAASIGQSLSPSASGALLAGFPTSTQVLLASVTSGDATWGGASAVAADGDVDVLLWPLASACALSGSVGVRTGAALGVIDAGHVLLAGGVAGAGNPSPTTFVVDLTRGASTPVADGLLTARSNATVTPFGQGGALAAGGTGGDGAALATAEVFVAGLHGAGDFDHDLITLSGPRTMHGAATLVTGETLLVGGVGATAGAVLGTLEIVDPSTRSAKTQGITTLAVPRASPHVLRLASGEILVAGGVDATGAPVPTLEWLKSDASGASRRTQTLVARPTQDFVALAGGGALAVVAPLPSDPPGFDSVWLIAADGTLASAAPVGDLSDVRLFSAPDGQAALWTGERWLLWSSWTGTFTALATTSGPLAAFPAASPDVGLALWLDGPSLQLVGMRSGAASAYQTFVSPLLQADTASMAPDRLGLAFDPSSGLTLGAGESAFVADATYDGVAIDFEAPTGAPADVVLRDAAGDEVEIGASTCPIPATQAVHVERDGADVVVGTATCAGVLNPSARVAIGFRGNAGRDASVVRSARIVRK